MEEGIIAIIGSTFVVPATIAVTIIMLRRFKNEERIKIIESGADASVLEFEDGKERGKFNTLRFALLLIGIGTGFLLGKILDSAFDMEEVGYFSMLFICGGIGLVLAYKIQDKKEE